MRIRKDDEGCRRSDSFLTRYFCRRLNILSAKNDCVGERLRIDFWRECLGCQGHIVEEGGKADEQMSEKVTSYTDLIHHDVSVIISTTENNGDNKGSSSSNNNNNNNSFEMLDVCECDGGGEWELDLDNEGFEFCVLCGTDRRIGDGVEEGGDAGGGEILSEPATSKPPPSLQVLRRTLTYLLKLEGVSSPPKGFAFFVNFIVETVLNSLVGGDGASDEEGVNICCGLCEKVIESRDLKELWKETSESESEAGLRSRRAKSIQEKVEADLPRLSEHLKVKGVKLNEFTGAWIER